MASSFDAARMSASFSNAPAKLPYGHSHRQSDSFSQPRSFVAPSTNGFRDHQAAPSGNPQIYTAVYSGVMVYEMDVQGIAVMRRRSDSWLNATQILKVAGVDKGRRTKILEKEILTGEHEKVQGGYGRYQGTWISYQRGRQFCKQYDVEDILRPLLDYDISSDGSTNAGKTDTPTKEQAMAANRKRFYNAGLENKMNGTGPGGTFFQNISPTASNALAAMNKAARFDNQIGRPGSAPRRASNLGGASFTENDLNGQFDPRSLDGTLEPPRKRIRPSSAGDSHPLDSGTQEETPTEPNESFMQASQNLMDVEGPVSLPPMQPPSTDSSEEKRLALLSMFDDASRGDLSSHPALTQLSGTDLDMPLDTSANTALHWAGTLARVSLMKSLLDKGANMERGNAASQTALMAAVQVSNSLDNGCFPEVLDLLGGLIDVRDAAGRTVLHHIAIASGIKGRAKSSRYYLESLLEYTVRHGGQSSSSQSAAMAEKLKKMNLTRFMSEVVNVQDRAGNTALNLAARIGNRPIINQLEEVGADFEIANYAGFKPTDFGIYPRHREGGLKSAISSQANGQESAPPNAFDQIGEEILATSKSWLAQTRTKHQAELQQKQDAIDAKTEEIRGIATEHAQTLAEFEKLELRARERSERQQKIANLKRSIKEQREQAQAKGLLNADGSMAEEPSIPKVDLGGLPDIKDEDASMGNGIEAPDESLATFVSTLPTAETLRAQLEAYKANNQQLEGQVSSLRSRSLEIENQYRRIVTMCTGVEEGKVDEVLENLVQAVESEASGHVDVGRVRDFLRKAEGAE